MHGILTNLFQKNMEEYQYHSHVLPQAVKESKVLALFYWSESELNVTLCSNRRQGSPFSILGPFNYRLYYTCALTTIIIIFRNACFKQEVSCLNSNKDKVLESAQLTTQVQHRQRDWLVLFLKKPNSLVLSICSVFLLFATLPW